MSIVRKEDNQTILNIKAVLVLLWKKLPFILLSAVLCGGIAFAIAYFLVTPKYEAGVTLYVNNKTQQESATSLTSSDLTASAQLVGTYSAILTSNSMLKAVIAEACIDNTVDELKAKMTIASVNDTEVFTVKILDEDPKAAARIANAVAVLAPQRISEIVEGSSVSTVDEAEIPTKIAVPNYTKWVLVGVAIGLFISILIVFVRGMMDTVIHSEADFTEWNYPILSTIPDLESASKSGGKRYGYAGK